MILSGLECEVHVVNDDFAIPTDGLLGWKEFERHGRLVDAKNRRLQFEDLYIPFINEEKFTIPPKSSQVIYAHVMNREKVGFVHLQNIKPGILFGNFVTNNIDGKAYAECLNITDESIEIEPPWVELEPCETTCAKDFFSDDTDEEEDVVDVKSRVSVFQLLAEETKDRATLVFERLDPKSLENLNEEEIIHVKERPRLFGLPGEKLRATTLVKHGMEVTSNIPMKVTMNKRRDKLSGAQYKNNAKQKHMREEKILDPTPKLENFFSISVTPSEENHTEYYEARSHQSTQDVNIAEHAQVSEKSESRSARAVDISHEQNLLMDDPANWPIDETFKTLIAKRAFNQNLNADFSSTKRVIYGRPRVLTTSVFYRTVGKYSKLRSWLLFSKSTNSVYCGPCKLFGDQESTLAKGYNNWSNIYRRLEEHENSDSHKTSCQIYLARCQSARAIDTALCHQISEEKRYWRDVLHRVVSVIRKLASRGLPFRGSDSEFGSLHNGNYMMALELLAEYDPFLRSHMEKYANKGSGSVSYLSATVCDEFISLMAQNVRETIANGVRKAGPYSIRAYSGAQSWIRRVNPDADYIPCSGHSLNLVGENAASSCPEAELRELQKSARTLKNPSETRWSARADACDAFCDSREDILTVLSNFTKNEKEKPVARAEASGLIKSLSSLERYFIAIFWRDILDRFNSVSKSLQSPTSDLTQGEVNPELPTAELYNLAEEQENELVNSRKTKIMVVTRSQAASSQKRERENSNQVETDDLGRENLEDSGESPDRKRVNYEGMDDSFYDMDLDPEWDEIGHKINEQTSRVEKCGHFPICVMIDGSEGHPAAQDIISQANTQSDVLKRIRGEQFFRSDVQHASTPKEGLVINREQVSRFGNTIEEISKQQTLGESPVYEKSARLPERINGVPENGPHAGETKESEVTHTLEGNNTGLSWEVRELQAEGRAGIDVWGQEKEATSDQQQAQYQPIVELTRLDIPQNRESLIDTQIPTPPQAKTPGIEISPSPEIDSASQKLIANATGLFSISDENCLSAKFANYEEHEMCAQPSHFLVHDPDIPSHPKGNCLFFTLIKILQLDTTVMELRRKLLASEHLPSCSDEVNAVEILSSDEKYGYLDTVYISPREYNINVCIHFYYGQQVKYCHVRANKSSEFIHVHLIGVHYTPFIDLGTKETGSTPSNQQIERMEVDDNSENHDNGIGQNTGNNSFINGGQNVSDDLARDIDQNFEDNPVGNRDQNVTNDPLDNRERETEGNVEIGDETPRETTDRVEVASKLRTLAAMNNDMAKCRSKEYRDRYSNPKQFREGEQVYFDKDPRLDKHDRHYVGPCEIIEIDYEKRNAVLTMNGQNRTVHIDKLKHAYEAIVEKE
ncbi:hypothetical protein QAD02_021752 [Eretmocerus hayati]|uniref:Uncharacterized protein n=1 Tax=Eretmocerus hayati TaxID=131215 RepID=A0ACC2PQT1_9HYME|nr:hypothetical protein QAD02_021752 [Eretmocerus hayati]